MKVHELIELLEQHDPDMPVRILSNAGEYEEPMLVYVQGTKNDLILVDCEANQ